MVSTVMTASWPAALLMLCCLPLGLASADDAAPPELRVAVVGGLSLCGVWPELVRRAEPATGLRITTVESAPKTQVVPRFAAGEADLLLIHGSDETFDLLARGIAAPLRAWAQNQHVLVGPPDDPAGVRQARDGAEALRRIAAADAPFVDFRDPGSFAIVQRLWRASGSRPGPRQQLADDAWPAQRILESVASRHAYVVVGEIPVVFARLPNPGLVVLLRDDPAMRRTYVLVEPGPAHPADAARRALAHRLADYLVSPAGQADLAAANRAVASEQRPGPWILPLPTPARAAPAPG